MGVGGLQYSENTWSARNLAKMHLCGKQDCVQKGHQTANWKYDNLYIGIYSANWEPTKLQVNSSEGSIVSNGVTKEGEQQCLSKCCFGPLAWSQRPVRIPRVEASSETLGTAVMHLAQVLHFVLRHTHAFCSNEGLGLAALLACCPPSKP